MNREKEIECEHIKNKLDKFQKYFKEEMNELEKYQIQNSSINFDENLFNIKYKKTLVTDRSSSGLLKNIAK